MKQKAVSYSENATKLSWIQRSREVSQFTQRFQEERKVPKLRRLSFLQVPLLLLYYKRMDSNQKLDSMTYKWDSYLN